MRAGDLRRRHAEQLLARTEVEPPSRERPNRASYRQYRCRSDQPARLAELPGDEVSYQRSSTGGQNYVDTLQRSILAPEVLVPSLGALVMAIKNGPRGASPMGVLAG